MASRRQQAAQRAVNAQARKNQQKQQKQVKQPKVARPAMKVWRQTELQSLPQMGGAASAASAYAVGLRSGEPNVKGGFRSTRIQHRELIASVSGTSGFTVANSLSLNPGLAATFPWLSTQAVGWEQYKFHKLRFCYYTRCSTATPGSMMMVPDYDAADAAPVSEQIASSYRDVVEEAPWIPEVCCRLDPQAMMEPGNRKYVRTGALAANLDVKTYDSGTFFLCTTDGSSTNWGKLWVEYDVEFFVPQLPSAGAGSVQLLIAAGGTLGTANIFGSAPVSYGPAIAAAAANVVTFSQVGQYYLSLTATTLGGAASFTTSLSGLTAGTVFSISNGSSAATYRAFYNVTAPNATITFTNAAVQSTSVVELTIGNATLAQFTNA